MPDAELMPKAPEPPGRIEKDGSESLNSFQKEDSVYI